MILAMQVVKFYKTANNMLQQMLMSQLLRVKSQMTSCAIALGRVFLASVSRFIRTIQTPLEYLKGKQPKIIFFRQKCGLILI